MIDSIKEFPLEYRISIYNLFRESKSNLVWPLTEGVDIFIVDRYGIVFDLVHWILYKWKLNVQINVPKHVVITCVCLNLSCSPMSMRFSFHQWPPLLFFNDHRLLRLDCNWTHKRDDYAYWFNCLRAWSNNNCFVDVSLSLHCFSIKWLIIYLTVYSYCNMLIYF